jgi:hypothetical protein
MPWHKLLVTACLVAALPACSSSTSKATRSGTTAALPGATTTAAATTPSTATTTTQAVPTSSAAPTTTTVPATTSSTTIDVAALAAKLDLCGMLTAEEVATIQLPVGAPSAGGDHRCRAFRPSKSPDYTQVGCDWGDRDFGGIGLDVQIYDDANRRSAAMAAFAAIPDTNPVPGLGDAAVEFRGGGYAFVKGPYVAVISVPSVQAASHGEQSQTALDDALLTLARKIAVQL